jgi:hypothetical protein
MAGNKQSGLKARDTIYEEQGRDFYKRIGKLGNAAGDPKTRGFSANRDLASRAGKLGGTLSRRGKAPKLTQAKRREIKREFASEYELSDMQVSKLSSKYGRKKPW